MYEELVRCLREHAKPWNCADNCICKDATQRGYGSCSDELAKLAADAIEELSRMEQDFRQYISDQVNREKGVYACCYCKHRESTNKYEPGCTLKKCDGVSGWAWGVPKEEGE